MKRREVHVVSFACGEYSDLAQQHAAAARKEFVEATNALLASEPGPVYYGPGVSGLVLDPVATGTWDCTSEYLVYSVPLLRDLPTGVGWRK